jgi:quercetin dioxygenase-like cupin family protein
MTAPQDLPYTIAGRELVAETAGLRVQILTLGSGESVPWHYHSTVSDIFICLEGTTVVETRAPRARHELDPGEHCVVPPMTAHEVTGKDGNGCRFTLVQGVGEHDFILAGQGAATDAP